MTSQVAGGLELAQAIDSLTRVLSQASLKVRQEESVFLVEPVELTLQVAPSRTGPGLADIEWRVLGLGDETLPHPGTVHSLTLRFAPRSPEQDSGQDVMEQRASSRGLVVGGGLLSEQDLGLDDQEAVIAGPVPGGPDVAGLESGAVGGVGDVTVVRVRCYLDVEPSGQPRRLVIEREVAAAPSDPRLDEIRRLSGEEHQGEDERHRLVDATAEYFADRIDNGVFGQVGPQRWEIRDMPNPAAVSEALDRSQQWLRGLIEGPLKSAGTQLGVALPVAELISSVGANFVTDPVARRIQGVSRVIDIVGIGFGAATGMHPVVVASIEHLARTEISETISETIVQGVTKAFDGLLAGIRDEPAPADPQPDIGRPAGLDRGSFVTELLAAGFSLDLTGDLDRPLPDIIGDETKDSLARRRPANSPHDPLTSGSEPMDDPDGPWPDVPGP